VAGSPCLIGNRALVNQEGIDVSRLQKNAAALAAAGKTAVYVAAGGKAIGLIALADVPKESAAPAVAGLKQRGLKVAMVTGDNSGTARSIALQLGMIT
jgi:P-type E1-E2 ATPase